MTTRRAMLAILGGLLIPTAAAGREVPKVMVRDAVQTWVRKVTADARPEAYVERMQPREVDGKVVGYVAHLSERGFCLAGADDLVLPVYFYCPDGEYDPTDPNLEIIFEEIEQRTLAFGEARRATSPPAANASSPTSHLRARCGSWAAARAATVPPPIPTRPWSRPCSRRPMGRGSSFGPEPPTPCQAAW